MGKSAAHILFILFCQLWSVSFAQNKKAVADSLLNLLKTDKQDTNRVLHLEALSETYQKTGEYKLSLQYGNEGLLLAQKLNYTNALAYCNSNIGVAYLKIGDYNKTLEYTSVALNIHKKHGDLIGIANAYNTIANAYIMQGNYAMALEKSLLSVKLKERSNNKKNLASGYNNLGIIYYQLNNFPKALEYHFAALKLKLEYGKKREIASSYNNIGTVYYSQKNFEKALEFFIKSIEVSEKSGDKSTLASSYQNIGNVYSDMNKEKLAVDYLERSLKIKMESGDKRGIASAYINMGQLLKKEKNYAKNKKQLLLALDIAREINAKDLIHACYEALSITETDLGDHKSAYEHYKLYRIYNDSLFNEESSKKTAQLSAQYESEKKDNEIKLLNKDKEKQAAITEAESKKQQIIIWSVVGGLLLVLILSSFIYNRWRITQKQKFIIEQQKHLVEEKQKEILDSIRYAKRIQTSLLPTHIYIHRQLNNLKN